MIIIDLSSYGPIISDRKTGDSILQMIMNSNPKENKIEINLEGIVSMATYSAKQIFGRLYIDLGADVFYKNIILKNEKILFMSGATPIEPGFLSGFDNTEIKDFKAAIIAFTVATVVSPQSLIIITLFGSS